MTKTIKDQLGRPIHLKETPKRIVSLVPSQTELLVDLGLEVQIVGLTKFCVHPKHLKSSKTIVGGTKDIKLDTIKALQPDIILCNKEENNQAIVDSCAKICTVHVSDIYSITDCLELINQYGRMFSVDDKALQISEKIKQKLEDFQEFMQHKSRKKVAYLIWRNPYMAVGNNTFINEMLQLNCFENVFEDLKRYPEISLEDLKNSNPDLVLLSSEPYPFKAQHISELMEHLPHTSMQLVDGEAFSWYGSHVIKSFDYFKTLQGKI